MSAPWYRLKDEALLLDVHVQPGSKRDDVVGVHGDRIKIRVAARAVGNAANQRLIAFLAEEFGVPSARVTLVSGKGGRKKRLAIERPARLPEWLNGSTKR